MNANNQIHEAMVIRWGAIQRLADELAILKDQFILTVDDAAMDQILNQMESLRQQIHDLIQLPSWENDPQGPRMGGS